MLRTRRRMEHSGHPETENAVRPARSLERTYWEDEGESAVRWLIGKINYGPYPETRDDLRKSLISDVHAWAEQTGNYHLALVCQHAIDGQASSLVRMNPLLGPTDRLVAVAASVLFYQVAESSDVELSSVDGDQAVFQVSRGNTALEVVVHPAATVAFNRSTGAQEAWRTSDGLRGFTVLDALLAVS